MSRVIRFPEPRNPCACCGESDIDGAIMPLTINGESASIMLCFKCAIKHASDGLDAYSQMIREMERERS